ncbi:MAG: IclR family transcriptional regulator [Pseudomonadota bacterium]
MPAIKKSEKASSLTRALRILQLFDASRKVWTVEELAHELDASTSSAYRDVQELSRNGFLDPVAGAGYVLGPAFIQYDRLIRQTDPLIRVAAPVMRELLSRTTQHATAILCRRFRDQVMCVHQEQGTGPHPVTTYERGIAMPMFFGASSKVILAHLEDRALKRLYLENETTILRNSGLPGWREFKEQLRLIRRAGHALTSDEVTVGLSGVAAPVLLDKQVIAGISVVFGDELLDEQVRARFPLEVMAAAAMISQGLSDDKSLISRG